MTRITVIAACLNMIALSVGGFLLTRGYLFSAAAELGIGTLLVYALGNLNGQITMQDQLFALYGQRFLDLITSNPTEDTLN